MKYSVELHNISDRGGRWDGEKATVTADDMREAVTVAAKEICGDGVGFWVDAGITRWDQGTVYGQLGRSTKAGFSTFTGRMRMDITATE